MTDLRCKLTILLIIIPLILSYNLAFALNNPDKELSIKKTEKALEEIDRHNFYGAFKLVEESIRLDPENEKAKKLYVLLYEMIGEKVKKKEKPVNKIEEKKEKEIIAEKKEPVKKVIKKIRKPQIVKPKVALKKRKKSIVVKRRELKKEDIREKKEKEPEVKKEDNIVIAGLLEKNPVIKECYLGGGLLFTSAGSDFVSSVDSNIDLLGVDLFWEVFLYDGNLSLVSDLKGTFMKVTGDERINVNYYYFDMGMKLREYYIPVNDNSLELGVKLSYTSFYLKNNEEEGAFNYTSVYGPKAGIFISDPVLSRFIDSSFLKNISFDFSIDMIYIPWKKDHPKVWQSGFRINYKQDTVKYFLSYNRFLISNEYQDTYDMFEFGIILKM